MDKKKYVFAIFNDFIGFTLLMLLALDVPLAWAKYTPPPDSKTIDRPTSTYPAGSRNGCAGTEETTLTAIAPHSHIGQTTSTRPTLVWFVPDPKPRSLELRLYGSQIQPIIQSSTFGFQSWRVPEDQTLTPGQTYTWQVVLICNKNRPSQSLVAEAELKVVPMPPVLASRLATTTEPLQRSQLYAEAGFWYDAFAEVMAIKDDIAKGAGLQLLKDLAALELAAQDSTSVQGQRLQQIIQRE